MLPSDVEFGFRRKNLSLIPREQRENNWIETIELINQFWFHNIDKILILMDIIFRN